MSYREETIGDCRKRSDKSTAIYALCEEDQTPRYVGKTDYYLHVRHKAHISSARKPYLPVHKWIAKRAASNKRLVIKLIEYVPSGGDWAARESYWISTFRSEGFDLLNLTEGGEGQSGIVWSQDRKDKVAAKLKTGQNFSCLNCGAQFWRKQNEILKGNNKFCSRRCYVFSLKGTHRPVSEICKSRGIIAAAFARKSRNECKRGHALSGENLFLTTAGSRGCKECRRLHKAAYLERKRG